MTARRCPAPNSSHGRKTMPGAMYHPNSSPSSPLAQRQVRRARVRTQALRRAADNNRDRLARAPLEDVATRLLAHGADTHGEEDVAVEGHGEVGGEGEEVGGYPGEGFGEAGSYTI